MPTNSSWLTKAPAPGTGCGPSNCWRRPPGWCGSDMADTANAKDGVGFRSDRGPILIALMLSTGLVAIDSTVVATAVPSIVRDVGGFASFPWLFSAYLLA